MDVGTADKIRALESHNLKAIPGCSGKGHYKTKGNKKYLKYILTVIVLLENRGLIASLYKGDLGKL